MIRHNYSYLVNQTRPLKRQRVPPVMYERILSFLTHTHFIIFPETHNSSYVDSLVNVNKHFSQWGPFTRNF